jgi:excisionase family DNA binding protein
MSEKKLITVHEAAEALSVSTVTIRRFVKQGKISHHRIGDRVLFSDSDIDTFLSSSAVQVGEK